MAAKRLDITPVFNHKKSIALVDTAEDLVDSLDNLSVCLKHIEEKHAQNKTNEEDGDASLYEKLKENLEVARDLTDTLKREKWRLSRRQMSIELRMGELEDYKSHLKKDMTDMNQTVESLSMRIIQLEEALVEAQEIQEQTDAERIVANKRAEHSEQVIQELEAKQAKLLEEVSKLKQQRTDSVLRKQHSELADKVDFLLIENKHLKELIREKEDIEIPPTNCKKDVPNEININGKESFAKQSGNVPDTEVNNKQKQPRSPVTRVITEAFEGEYV